MRRKNLMRLTAAMGMIMACSQVMQAAAPVWGNETVEETTAGSHDDLIEEQGRYYQLYTGNKA